MKQRLKKYYDLLGRYRALYLLSAIELIIFILWSFLTGQGESHHYDTISYYAAYDVFTTGTIDAWRTPLYPLIIGIPKSLFGYKASVFFVYIFQSILFLCSIKWIGDTLGHITSSNRVAYWFTTIYALYPGVLSLCGILLSESLSVSLVTAEIYLLSEAYYYNSSKKAVLSGLLCFLLWLLRPALLPITVVLLVFWVCILLRIRERKKVSIYGLCATFVSVIGLGIYSMMFYNAYNRMAISCVTAWNNYSTLREADLIDIERIESPVIKFTVDSAMHNHPPLMLFTTEAEHIQNIIGVEEFGKFVDDQLKQHPKEILSYLYHQRLHDGLLTSTCVFTGAAVPPPFLIITNLLYVNNSTILLLYFIGLCILINNNIKRKSISYFIWLIFSLFAANYFTVWVGGPAAFHRLITPNYPLLIAVLCWLLDQLVAKAISPKQ